jgi:hypothetical protein
LADDLGTGRNNLEEIKGPDRSQAAPDVAGWNISVCVTPTATGLFGGFAGKQDDETQHEIG